MEVTIWVASLLAKGFHRAQNEEHRSLDLTSLDRFDCRARLLSTGQVFRIDERTNEVNIAIADCGRTVAEPEHVAKAAGSEHAVLVL